MQRRSHLKFFLCWERLETKNKEALKHHNIVSYEVRNDAKTHKAPNPIDIPKSRINRQAETTKAVCIVTVLVSVAIPI